MNSLEKHSDGVFLFSVSCSYENEVYLRPVLLKY